MENMERFRGGGGKGMEEFEEKESIIESDGQ
jgi:hypothetical protein